MKVFIDGNQGTTGLKIHGKLRARRDVELLEIPEEHRKDPRWRAEYMAKSDVTFLCLPDAAAIEAVGLAGAQTRILDASTAHRTEPGWAYGFPELGPSFRQAIAEGNRVAVPGCHASGFVALTRPLRDAGILGADAELVCFSLTGYSGGGKKMIAEYESEDRSAALDSPRQYGLGQTHKHLKEMKFIAGLDKAPCFSPIVADFRCGMEVTVPLFGGAGVTRERVLSCYRERYGESPVVSVWEAEQFPGAEGGYLAANALAGKDTMAILVGGNDERILVSALFDNLGKGASGAAVQCMNIMFGLEETLGLER